jgi:hypothetical protein
MGDVFPAKGVDAIICPMRILFIILALVMQLWAVDSSEPTLNNKPRTADVLKGTVVHVFENFVTDNTTIQRIAKVRLLNAPQDKESLVIVDIPLSVNIYQGDQVLINKVEHSETFDMGDSFDSTYVFSDFARDHAVVFILASFCILLFFINRASLYPALLIGANLLLIGGVLPLLLMLGQPIVVWLFILLFFAVNGYMLQYVLPSKKFILALTVSCASSLLLMICYTFFSLWAHVQEYTYLQKMIPGTVAQNLVAVDALALAIANFFITFYVVLFVIRVSYVHTIYDNVKIAALRVFYIYFLLGVGLSLPTVIFSVSNDLGTAALFNYMPFVLTLLKMSFLFWGTCSATVLYLFLYYINNKHYFQKHIIIPAEGKKQQVDVQRIVSGTKLQAANPRRRSIKKKANRR